MDRLLWLCVFFVLNVTAGPSRIVLVARNGSEPSRDLLFYVTMLDAKTDTELRRSPFFASVDPAEQAGSICTAWQLEHTQACADLAHQLSYSWEQEKLARADTRDTLSTGAGAASDSGWEDRDDVSWKNNGIFRKQARQSMAQYAQQHGEILRGERAGGVLVCQPTGGLGNQLNGLMSCLVAALAAGRAMLIDWRASMQFNNIRRGQNAPAYPIGLNQLLKKPLGWDWDLDAHIDGPLQLGSKMSSATELAWNSEKILCSNLTQLKAPLVVLTMWAWLPGFVANPFHAPQFEEWFGRDQSNALQVYSQIGQAVLAPVNQIQMQLDALRTILRPQDGNVIGMQIRSGATLFDAKARRPMMNQPDAVAHFVRCSFATMLSTQRNKSNTWLVVSDSTTVRTAVLHRLGGGSQVTTHELGGGMRAVETRLDRPRGGRVVFLANNIEAHTKQGTQMALLEIWALGLSSQLIVSEDSSFADVSHGLFPKPTFMVTRAGQCYQTATTEPIGPGLTYFEKVSCFSPKMIDPTWLWQNSEQLEV